MRFAKISYFCLCLSLVLTALLGCMEDETFTDNPSRGLSFSTDTVDFRTVFTGISSHTEEITIYNNNSDGVRLQSVCLAGGASSNFRINVDGQYGTDFTDIEIFGKDSIFIFVEVTPHQQQTDTLFSLSDSILFTLPNGMMQKVLLIADGQNITVLKGKVISKETTLTADRPYVIYDSIRIDSGITLNIQPGTTLYFHDKADMKIHGTLNALGTLEQPITFRGDRLDNLLPTIPYDNTAAQWGGIHIYPESENNMLDFCDIHGGNYGIKVDATTKEKSLTLTNSIVNNVAGNCLELVYCGAEIGNCQITNGMGDCVKVVGGTIDITHCTIAQFYLWNNCGNALSFTNYQDSLIFPLDMLSLTNCIVTGWQDDEVKGSVLDADSIRFEYSFRNCLLQADTTGMDSLRLIGSVIDTDTATNKKKNFKKVISDDYTTDFSLDSLSKARGIGEYVSSYYLQDRRGKARPKEKGDAGCYQY